jgi:hypothetical protein
VSFSVERLIDSPVNLPAPSPIHQPKDGYLNIALRIDEKNDCGCKNAKTGTNCFSRTTLFGLTHGGSDKAEREL